MTAKLRPLLRAYLAWMRQLPLATGVLFAARTPWGRSLKIFLFAVGVFLPLGSLLWCLLYWHGRSIAAGSAQAPILPLLPVAPVEP